MFYKDIFILSSRGFKDRSSRTLLTILGLGVGFGAVLFLVGMGYGLQNILLKEITTDSSLLTLDVMPGESELLVLNKDQINIISNLENIDIVSPRLEVSSQISTDDLTTNTGVSAVDSSYLKLEGTSLFAGRIFNDDFNEIIVSTATAKLFGIEDPKEVLGKGVSLQLLLPTEILLDPSEEELIGGVRVVDLKEKYTIVGIVDNAEAGFVYFPLRHLKDFNINTFNSLKVKVDSNEFLGTVRTEIFNLGFQVSSLSDTVEQVNKIFGVIQIILGVFGFVALVVSAIGMFNTMTITLLERTSEVGIMKAIGASNKDIAFIFLSEAMIMGFSGGIAGLGIGIVAEGIFNIVLNVLAGYLGGTSVDIFYNPPWFLAVIVLFSVVVGLLTGIPPSRRAAKLDALQALRYK